jgi:uncharacterized protein
VERNQLYNDYSSYIKRIFGARVQKISINAGFSCPNIDGSKSFKGCIYCDNSTFNPFYCDPRKSIIQQIDEGIGFFSKKYKTQKYLAYFQSHTNTYNSPEELSEIYYEALNHPLVVGLVIATRPDCIDENKLEIIREISEKYYVSVEYGVESTNNETLKIVNRCHTFEDSVNAIKLTAEKNINVCIHLILGLPYESKEGMLEHAIRISKLPVTSLKLHQLQFIKNTPIVKLFESNPEAFISFKPEDYIEFVIDFLELLNPAIVIERFISESPLDMIKAQSWKGLKNFEIVEKIRKRMKEKKSWQGKRFVHD